MTRTVYVCWVIGFIWLFVALSDSQTVTCRTVGNSVRFLNAIRYIELTFSAAYESGTYSINQAIASLKVKHVGLNNRPFVIVDIQYPTSTTVRVYLYVNIVGSYKDESTTGYQFNVSHVPLVNRTGHWLSFSADAVQSFSCLTVDNSPPVAELFNNWKSASNYYYHFYFSEPVTGNFTATGILIDAGSTISSCIAYPYLPNLQGYSRHYHTTACTITGISSAFVGPNANLVTDVAGNLNVLSPTKCRLFRIRDPLVVTTVNPADPIVECPGLGGVDAPSTSQYDLDEDGAIDTVYFHTTYSWNEQTFNSTNLRLYGAKSNNVGTMWPRSDPLPFSTISDGDSTDNQIAFSVSTSNELYRSWDIVYFAFIGAIDFPLFYFYRVNLTSTTFPFQTYGGEDHNFVVSPIIMSAIARNRTYICAIVSRNNSIALTSANFYLASSDGNTIVGYAENSKYESCLVLGKPLTNNVVHHRYTWPDLLFLEPVQYAAIQYYSTTIVPTWKGSRISMLEYVAPLLVFSELFAGNNETTWKTLRLVFDEAVNVDNRTCNVTIVPYGFQARSMIYLMNASWSSATQINSYTIDIPLSVSCFNDSYCYGTDTPSFQVERIEGFEDTFFNLMNPLVSGVVTPYDSVRPHLMRSRIVTSSIVQLVFSEAIDFGVSPASSVSYSSFAGRTFVIDPDINGNVLTLNFNVPTSYDILTIQPCGILVKDLNGNDLACDTSTPTIITFGTLPPTSSSSSSSSTGIASLSSSSGSVDGTHTNSTFATNFVSSDVFGVSFPLFLSLVFSFVTTATGINFAISYLTFAQV